MNERRNPTLYADNRFFSSSFHGFFPEGMTVWRSGSGQIGVKSPLRSSTGWSVKVDPADLVVQLNSDSGASPLRAAVL